jgi:hypothetical protein
MPGPKQTDTVQTNTYTCIAPYLGVSERKENEFKEKLSNKRKRLASLYCICDSVQNLKSILLRTTWGICNMSAERNFGGLITLISSVTDLVINSAAL